jgi:diguanylate cyclase
MDIAYSTVVVGIFLGVVPVLLGVILGAWMMRGRTNAETPRRPEPEQAQELVAGLLPWAHTIQGDVSQYSSQMQNLSRRLHQTERAAAADKKEATPPSADSNDLLADMEHSNVQLQTRLHKAEAALANQAKQLKAYLSQAHTDPLTGLPNRRAFDEELARRNAEFCRKGSPLSIVLVDIDRFKAFNDDFGHMAGDEVLKAVADRLRDSHRDIDMVARLGGEEFAVVLPDTTTEKALLSAERCRLTVAAEVFRCDGRQVSLTISCGVAELQPGETVDLFLRRADEALYLSKGAGRNCTHLHNGLQCKRVHVAGLVPVAPPTRRTASEPTGLVPPEFSGVCRDLRSTLLERLSGA